MERQCPDKAAHSYILQNLAFVNANDDCKKIISTLPKQPPTVTQMLSAYSKISTPQYLATVQANVPREQITKSHDSLRNKF